MKPPTPDKTYGYYRVEILASLINAMVLLAMAAFILYEAYRRFLVPRDVVPGPMIIIAGAGLLVNGLGMWLLHRHAGQSLNVKGAYLEVMSDALGSLAVLLAALVLITTGWRFVDPLLGGAIGLFIVPRTWLLLTEAVNILLEGTPAHINIAELEQAMKSVPGVRDVHDLHVWTLTSGKYAMSGHVRVDETMAGNEVLRELQRILHERFEIHHTTIQIEVDTLLQIQPPENDA